MSPPEIHIHHRGRMANKMFQAMVAAELKARVPDARILGLNIPEWNLVSEPANITRSMPVLRGQQLNLDEAAWLLRSGTVEKVGLDVWGQRLSYFGHPRRYNSLFKPVENGRGIRDDQILVNVRAEDIVSGWHSKYFPLPYAYYDHVIETSGLKPVFMGQLDESDYVTRLKSRYSGADFLPLASPLVDFETIRNAKNVALSISTFAWLAAWLSEKAVSIHMPVSGIYDPLRSQTLLLPVDDPRYRFYQVDFPDMDARKRLDLAQWASHGHNIVELDTAHVRQLILRGMLPQGGARPGKNRPGHQGARRVHSVQGETGGTKH